MRKVNEEVPKYIPFMHWGIITEENAQGVPPFRFPIKRYDPFRTRKIQLNGQYIGKVHGGVSYIRAARNDNPLSLQTTPPKISHEFDKLVSGTAFCLPILMIDQQNRVKMGDDLFSTSLHKYSFEPNSAISLIDRFPPMVRVDNISSAIPNMAYGISLITFPTNLYMDFLQMPLEQLEMILHAIKESQQLIIQECAGNSVKLTPEERYVSTIPFEIFLNLITPSSKNNNPIFAKLYADLSDSGHSTMMEQAILTAKERQEEGEGCMCCHCERGGIFEFGGMPMPFEMLRIAENDFGTLCAAFAPSYNFQLKIVPRRHVRTFIELTHEEIRGNAELFRLGMFGLDLLKVTKNRRIRLTQLPAGYGPIVDFHMRWSIDPLGPSFDGYERFDDQKEVIIFPEAFAEELRKRFIKRRIISEDLHEVNTTALEFHIEAKNFSTRPSWVEGISSSS
ncbi:MAG: hypothetical protein ACE5R6_03135 [Candidatus Heimdallarchaeota archaeon]